MALTVWESAKSATLERLTGGAAVSVAVVVSGSTTALKWKREKPDGTWPSDAQAITIAALSSSGVFAILETSQGVLVGDGISRFWLTRDSNPTATNNFQAVYTL